MSLEEGEIKESAHADASALTKDMRPYTSYDPAYEWPNDSPVDAQCTSDALCTPSTSGGLKVNQPTFRLIVLETSILSPKHKLGLLDGHNEVQFGRDVAQTGSTTPKIRLKEMAVSKLHATAYWDAGRQEWNIVDMGSMHGTFLRSESTLGADNGPGVRLSASRQASLPRKLKHMDKLTIGGTSFLIHMHDNQLACEDCWSSGKYEIPLFPVSKSGPQGSSSVSVTNASSTYTPKASTDPKKALTLLKQSLLSQHDLKPSARPSSTPPSAQQYIDRSARRRALIPSFSSDAPGVSAAQVSQSEPSSRPRSPEREPTSEPPTPVPTSNIGHKLLLKQGWAPGSALGVDATEGDGRIGLVVPLEVTATTHRAGLGMKRASDTTVTTSGSDWKEQAKRRRWDNVE